MINWLGSFDNDDSGNEPYDFPIRSTISNCKYIVLSVALVLVLLMVILLLTLVLLSLDTKYGNNSGGVNGTWPIVEGITGHGYCILMSIIVIITNILLSFYFIVFLFFLQIFLFSLATLELS